MITIGSDFAYFAKKPCGCMAMTAVIPTDDDPAWYKSDVAKEVAACIRAGYEIEKVTVEWVRTQSIWGCVICQPQRFKTKAATHG